MQRPVPSTIPDSPGSYQFKDRAGRIIYVGKAASLRNRVRHYFQTGTRRSATPKLRSLIHSIADFDLVICHNEADAILSATEELVSAVELSM